MEKKIKAHELRTGNITKWGTVKVVDADRLNVMVLFENGQMLIFPNDKTVTIGKAK
jgi:hypothetical protein